MAWLSRVSAGMHYFPQIAIPLALVGVGHRARVHAADGGRASRASRRIDAGAASGLLNVAQQLGASLGLGILITVFAAARRTAERRPLQGLSRASRPATSSPTGSPLR